MNTRIKHSDDALRLLKQDLARENLVEFARKREMAPDTDIFFGYTRTRDRQGPINVAMVFCIVAIAAFTAATLLA